MIIAYNRYEILNVKRNDSIHLYDNNIVSIFKVKKSFIGSIGNNQDNLELIAQRELLFNTCTNRDPANEDKYIMGHIWFNIDTGDVFILKSYNSKQEPEWYKINSTKQSNIKEFLLIERGRRIRYAGDPIDDKALKNGFELFCPHSKEEYEEARKYLLAKRKPKSMGPLGIYYPKNGPGCCRWRNMKNHALNSDDLGKLGWKVQDGSSTWWASDRTNVSEPNGDYTARAYLGISYDNYGNIYWYNDANSRYSYTTYLCVKRK